MNISTITRLDIEEFLIQEAHLLDEWRLHEWRQLFTKECRYLVPVTNADPQAGPEGTLHYIADDGFRLTHRVGRLMKKTGHAEYPRAKVLHMISNVRITGRDETMIEAASNFSTYRSHRTNLDIYVGHHEYRFVIDEGALRIQQKRSVLHMEALRPHGRISLIV